MFITERFRNGVKVYRCEVCVDRKRRNKTFIKKSEAVKWAEKLEDKGILTKHNLYDALDEYRSEVIKLKGWQPALSRLNSLKRDLPNLPLTEINKKVIKYWKDKRLKQISPASVAREAILLRSCFTHCVEELEWLHENPMAKVARVVSPPRAKGIAQDKIAQTIEKLKDAKHGAQVTIMFKLALETGARLGELVKLRWENVNDNRMTLLDTKNGSDRVVALSTTAKALLKEREGFHDTKVFTLSVHVASQTFRRYRVEGIRFHDSRSEAITRLSKKLTILELSSMVGHKDLQSLHSYYHDEVEQVANKLG